MVWRVPTDHTTDCYFCFFNTKLIGQKNLNKITYHNIRPAIRPVMHCEELPIPVFRGFTTSDGDDTQNHDMHNDPDIQLPPDDSSSANDDPITACQQFSQPELNDLVRDLGLSKKSAELLASRLQEKKLTCTIC